MSDFLGMGNAGWPINLVAQKCTIASGASGSEIIATQGKALVGLIMPAAWTAAAIQYYGSIAGSPRELKVLKDGGTGNLLQTLVAADDWVVFPMSDAFFGTFLQLVSVTAASVTPVAQGADRDIILLFRNFVS